ncbi:MAG: 30S ribosomal protein S1 [Dictyoglomus sp. NZ13-RE01]|nr:MAG: 30S ribosomal protein S1 [Dictyoglomus sp. NZ13-RE01]
MEEIVDINLEDISMENLEIGSIVYGNILLVDKQGLWLDVGGKYNAFLPIEETTKSFQEKLEKNQIKDSIPVMIQFINYKEGIINVSQKRAVEKKIWEDLTLAYENDEPISGKIKDFNGKGFTIDLGEEVYGFIPLNLIDIYRPKNPNIYLNRKVNAKIIKINPERKQILLSVRSVLEEKLEEKRTRLWERIKKSEIIRGRVKEVNDDGLKIDLGFGILGFVSKDELSWFPIRNIYRTFQVGDIVKAKILNIDEEKKEVNLSVRLAQPNPWEVFLEKNPIGSIQQGEIIKITSGIVVKINNLVGFVPYSEISWGRIGNIREYYEVGDKIKVKILEVDPQEKRILLSIKQVEPNPWDVIDEILSEGSKVKGKIINITDFGIFVEIKPGLEGLIPRRFLSWERINDLHDKFHIGDSIEAKVLNIDKENRRLLLSRRDVLPDPWNNIEERYSEGMNVIGKVIEINNQGLVIELQPGIEGFLPNSQLDKRENSEISINSEIEVKIIRINQESRRIIFSRKALLKEKEEKELENYIKINTPPPITLGDILGFDLAKEEN